MRIQDWLLASVDLPDPVIRWGIRRELSARLRVESGFLKQSGAAHKEAHVQKLKNSPISIHTDAANEQHYEVPAAFFEQVLGANLKYSSGLYVTPDADLDAAELAMLALSCDRALLSDGQRILELGCGWGSLTLYMAKHYPNSHITAVSNSASQKQFIDAKCRERSLNNVSVITADIAVVDFDVTFDRIVSVEMFEHVRNYEALFRKCASWLTDDGFMFVHVFGHRELAYLFDTADSWMAKYFFAGGQMPSFDLFLRFQDQLIVQDRWVVSGMDYAKTCRDWLVNMDRAWPVIAPVFVSVYGPKAAMFRRYWRIFFMACEELFAWEKGNEWQVYHYRFCKKALR
jgi:cyclopropane-fatty-acyl-phospholipid synthase